MPELPEVETALRGIAPHLTGARIECLVVRQRQLRYPVAEGTEGELEGRRILALRRRGKYLLLELDRGGLLIHLGMSGSVRILPSHTQAERHDHLDLRLTDGRCLRLRDPRRFGTFLWTPEPLEDHPLIRGLGAEPLTPDFHGDFLYTRARGRRVPVKAFIMDARIVVGIGNIYANESLFAAGVHPHRPCARIGRTRYRRLANAVKAILRSAIQQGGTTLRDFVREDGTAGYFALDLQVYAREGEPCPRCGAPIRQRRVGQRSSFFCPRCQR
jgi:formamidopyrimidine-DNA glycosylase